jgi:hypothetical protein
MEMGNGNGNRDGMRESIEVLLQLEGRVRLVATVIVVEWEGASASKEALKT